MDYSKLSRHNLEARLRGAETILREIARNTRPAILSPGQMEYKLKIIYQIVSEYDDPTTED